jgi:hypothetical protein
MNFENKDYEEVGAELNKLFNDNKYVACYKLLKDYASYHNCSINVIMSGYMKYVFNKHCFFTLAEMLLKEV